MWNSITVLWKSTAILPIHESEIVENQKLHPQNPQSNRTSSIYSTEQEATNHEVHTTDRKRSINLWTASAASAPYLRH